MFVAVFILVYLLGKPIELESVKINETQPVAVINSCMRLLSDCTLNKLTAIPKRYETLIFPWLCKKIIYNIHSLNPSIWTACALCRETLFNKHKMCSSLSQMSQKAHTASPAHKFHIHDCPVLVWFLFVYTHNASRHSLCSKQNIFTQCQGNFECIVHSEFSPPGGAKLPNWTWTLD